MKFQMVLIVFRAIEHDHQRFVDDIIVIKYLDLSKSSQTMTKINPNDQLSLCVTTERRHKKAATPKNYGLINVSLFVVEAGFEPATFRL